MLELILIFITVLVGFIYLADIAIHNTKSGKLFDQIPGPSTLPIIGNALDFVCSPTQLFHLGRNLTNTYKNIFRTWGFSNFIVNLYDPEDLEVILSSQKHITKSYVYDFVRPWLKEGLLTSQGTKWHNHRKILTPAFHFNILQEFCDIFEKNCDKLVNELQKVSNKEIDIVPYLTYFALNTISETAMGTDLDTIEKQEKEKYKSAIFEMGHSAVQRLVRFWLQPPILFWLTSLGRRQKKYLPILHDFSMNVIRKRRNERKGCLENVPNGITENEKKPPKKRMAMLDLLLSAEEKGIIDEEGIRQEVDTFMFEGHDTTAMALTFCLMQLANDKDIQDRVYEETRDILENNPDSTLIDKLNQMKYLEMCIKEALRLYPSVIMIGRILHEDVKLPKYTLPAGTTCNIHIFDLHRRADLFPNPYKFDPDRFLVENCAKRHPFAYIPFSAGPRNCIGQRFAILEEKAVISSILQKFILEPVTKPDDIIFTADLVLRNLYPTFIKFVPRS